LLLAGTRDKLLVAGENRVAALTLKMNFDAVEDSEALRFARDIRRDLEALDGIEVSSVEGESKPGARGELSMIGAFALAVMSHEVVPILVNVLKSYISRDDRVEFEVSLPNGKTVRINSSPSSVEQLKSLISEAGV
jgi:hypothetical protein